MTYPKEVADVICARLAEGESLLSICRDEGMPSYATVKRWEIEDEEFRANSTRAREIGCHALADECLEIADKKDGDFVNGDDGPTYVPEAVQRSKLRIETRLRLLGKWLPRVYGDKLQTELTGANGGPVQITASSHDEAL